MVLKWISLPRVTKGLLYLQAHRELERHVRWQWLKVSPSRRIWSPATAQPRHICNSSKITVKSVDSKVVHD
jgi:hypothetical protein